MMEINGEEISLAREYVAGQQQLWADRLRKGEWGDEAEEEFNRWSARLNLLNCGGEDDLRSELLRKWARDQRD
jgi:hypothetical protein